MVWLSSLEMGTMFSLSPPIPITKSIYLCEKKFQLDDLKALYDHENIPYYAVIIINARETKFWMVNDLEIRPLQTIELSVTNKHSKGGQSAPRFGRIFQDKRDRNDTHVIDSILSLYYDYDKNRPKVHGFIIGGVADTRDRVFKDPDLDIIRDYIVTNQPCSSNDANALYEQSALARQIYETKINQGIISELEETIEKDSDRILFGIREVQEGLALFLLKKCFIPKSDEIIDVLKNHKCEFIKVDDNLIEKWGLYVGVKF